MEINDGFIEQRLDELKQYHIYLKLIVIETGGLLLCINESYNELFALKIHEDKTRIDFPEVNNPKANELLTKVIRTIIKAVKGGEKGKENAQTSKNTYLQP